MYHSRLVFVLGQQKQAFPQKLIQMQGSKKYETITEHIAS